MGRREKEARRRKSSNRAGEWGEKEGEREIKRVEVREIEIEIIYYM